MINDLWREQIIAFAERHLDLTSMDIAMHYIDVWFSEELITEGEIDLACESIKQVIDKERGVRV